MNETMSTPGNQLISFVATEEGPIGAETSCYQNKKTCSMWIVLKIPPLVQKECYSMKTVKYTTYA